MLKINEIYTATLAAHVLILLQTLTRSDASLPKIPAAI